MKAMTITFIVIALLVGIVIGTQFRSEIKCLVSSCREGPRLAPDVTQPHRCAPDKPCIIPELERDSDL